MIKTQEQIDIEKKTEFHNLINKLGGYVKLEKPIRFTLTPHSPITKIYQLSKNDVFKNFGEAQDAVLQTLRRLTYKTK